MMPTIEAMHSLCKIHVRYRGPLNRTINYKASFTVKPRLVMCINERKQTPCLFLNSNDYFKNHLSIITRLVDKV